MARLHLFEFEDQRWFPSFLRNYGTDFLQFLANKTKMYKPIIPVLDRVFKKKGITQLIDLGSGGGGGLIWINSELKKNTPDLKITLTDYYPNLKAFEKTKSEAENFDFVSASVDARNVPKELKGMRTMFLSFHHFKPADAKQILQNAINSKEAIGIFEAQERSALSIIAMLFSPITVLLTTPFIRPFSLGRIIFTYLIPIVPLFVLWDGVVSALRTYTFDEMINLIDSLENHDQFQWQIDRVKSGPSVVLYLIGYPK
jgi:hypothetical protein